MSSNTVKDKVIIFPCIDSDEEESFNFNEILIPFSNFESSQNLSYIYNGNENIRFNERHPVYRRLLFDEFNNT